MCRLLRALLLACGRSKTNLQAQLSSEARGLNFNLSFHHSTYHVCVSSEGSDSVLLAIRQVTECLELSQI